MKNTLAAVLSEIITATVSEALSGGRECRLIFPGLTEALAVELHQLLDGAFRARQIPAPTYLALDDKDTMFAPNQEKKWLRYEALTSVRFGNFVAVCMPKVLPRLHDSVRGSGSPIRAETFSDEWPWRDHGMAAFRFDGPVLDAILEKWCSDHLARDALRQLIVKGLLRATAPLRDANRVQLLVEDILGSFDPSDYPEIENTFDQFCYHCGIPRLVSWTDTDIRRYIESVEKCARSLDEQRRKDPGFRAHLVQEVIPNYFASQGDVTDLQEAVQLMLDGAFKLGAEAGLLAFHGGLGFGSTSKCENNWRRLDVDTLCKLFGVGQEDALRCEILPRQGEQVLVSNDGKSAAIFWGAHLEVTIEAETSEERFIEDGLFVQCKRGNREIWQIPCTERSIRETKYIPADHLPDSRSPVSLSVQLVRLGKVVANSRICVHVCGDKRPAFTVLEPGFRVENLVEINANEPDGELDPLALIFEEPVMAHVLDWMGDTSCQVSVEGTPCDVSSLSDLHDIGGPGHFYKLAERVDTEGSHGGRVELRIEVSGFGRDITLECSDIEPGEFTLEDEFRVAAATANTKRLQRVLPFFSGEGDLDLPKLGDIDAATRKRMDLAGQFETRGGWKPIILNVLSNTLPAIQESDYWKAEGGGPRFLSSQAITEDVRMAVSRYEDCRNKLLAAAKERHSLYSSSSPKPLYVIVPNYVAKDAEIFGRDLDEYLSAYCEVLDLLGSRDHSPGNAFLLAHLDSVVLDQAGGDHSSLDLRLALLGPWHPLVLAKRFMVQRSIYEAAGLDSPNGRKHRHLISLFERVDGFRVVPGFDIDTPGLDVSFAFPTSDPGWHVALSNSAFRILPTFGPDGPQHLGETIRHQLGLTSVLHLSDAELWGETFLQSFHRSHPSRRQLGVRVSQGVDPNSIVSTCVRLLHDKEGGTTDFGDLLPGGIHVYLDSKLENRDPLDWRRPMVHVYEGIDDDRCYENFRPDVLLLPRGHNPQPTWALQNIETEIAVPRGQHTGSVFHLPLVWLEPDKDGLPVPRAIESNAGGGTSQPVDLVRSEDDGSPETVWFSRVLHRIDRVVERYQRGRPALAQALGLPRALKCDWTVLPGSQVDAGALARYVADGKANEYEDRALWDYRLGIGKSVNSYFIVCKVPMSVRIALKKSALTLDDEAVSRALRVLAEVGFAVGETMRSGKAAVGVLGVVGALRLLQSAWPNETSAHNAIGQGCCTVLIPVDSFTDVLVARSGVGATKKRADLLAIRLAWRTGTSARLALSACAVECKFTSADFPAGAVADALGQAQATSDVFQEIVELALSNDGMHARLALAHLIRFGMRLLAARDQVTFADEQVVLRLILSGTFDLVDPITKNLLVSTSCASSDNAKFDYLPGGWWVNFTMDSWPTICKPWDDPIVKQVSKNFIDAEKVLSDKRGELVAPGTRESPPADPAELIQHPTPTAPPPTSVTGFPSGVPGKIQGGEEDDLNEDDLGGVAGEGAGEGRIHHVFEGFVGNQAATQTLSLFLDYAKHKGVKRILSTGLTGPRSTGKTELSRRVSTALGIPTLSLSETSLRDVDQLVERMESCAREAGQLMSPVAREGGHMVLLAPPMLVFIDEVHQLSARVQDSLLTVLEAKDRMLRGSKKTIDARNVSFMIATTDWGKLREPLRSRVRRINLNPYSTQEVAAMLSNLTGPAPEANEGHSEIDPATENLGPEALNAIATAARAIPRVAIQLLSEIGMALALGELPNPSLESVWVFLKQKVPCDRRGLTWTDRKYLRILSARNPVGLDNLATELDTDRSNVEKEIEPFLVQMGWVQRGSAGRSLTPRGRNLIMELAGEID